MKVKELLMKRGRSVITIGQNESVAIAIQKLVESNIGALPVCDTRGTMVGIVSERDLLKECSQRSGETGKIKVKDVMTREVAIGIPEDDLNYVTDVMTQKGIRHLPILEGQTLEGIISIRDIVDAQLEESKAVVRFLNDYISGGFTSPS